MNKELFEKELMKRLGLSEEQIKSISVILENNLIIGKKAKEQIISSIIEKLNTNEEDANRVYETAMDIIKDEVKNKLKHPFKSID